MLYPAISLMRFNAIGTMRRECIARPHWTSPRCVHQARDRCLACVLSSFHSPSDRRSSKNSAPRHLAPIRSSSARDLSIAPKQRFSIPAASPNRRLPLLQLQLRKIWRSSADAHLYSSHAPPFIMLHPMDGAVHTNPESTAFASKQDLRQSRI